MSLTTQSLDWRIWANRLVGLTVRDKQLRVPYGQLPRHTLDIYYSTRENREGPILLFLHGGGWKDGSNDLYRFVGATLSKRGITTVIPNYRLHPQVKYPAFMEDVASAYAWTEKNIVAASSKSCGITLMGHSAGAHMAALLAYDPSYLKKADVKQPKRFIGLAGPYAFDAKTWKTTKEIFEPAPTADKVRPLAHVSPKSPVSLLLYGAKDTVVLKYNSDDLAAKLRVPVTYNILPEYDHITLITALASPDQNKELVKQIVEFAKSGKVCKLGT